MSCTKLGGKEINYLVRQLAHCVRKHRLVYTQPEPGHHLQSRVKHLHGLDQQRPGRPDIVPAQHLIEDRHRVRESDRTPKTKLARLVKLARPNLITTRLRHPSRNNGQYLFSALQATLTNWIDRQIIRKVMIDHRVFCNSSNHDQNIPIVSIGNGSIALSYSSLMFF